MDPKFSLLGRSESQFSNSWDVISIFIIDPSTDQPYIWKRKERWLVMQLKLGINHTTSHNIISFENSVISRDFQGSVLSPWMIFKIKSSVIKTGPDRSVGLIRLEIGQMAGPVRLSNRIRHQTGTDVINPQLNRLGWLGRLNCITARTGKELARAGARNLGEIAKIHQNPTNGRSGHAIKPHKTSNRCWHHKLVVEPARLERLNRVTA